MASADERVLESGKGGMKMVRADGYRSPLELADPEWSPEEVLACQSCGSVFGFFVRRVSQGSKQAARDEPGVGLGGERGVGWTEKRG